MEIQNFNDFSPAMIKLYKNQTEWLALVHSTTIRNDITSIKGFGGTSVSFEVSWKSELLYIRLTDKNLEFKMPTKNFVLIDT